MELALQPIAIIESLASILGELCIFFFKISNLARTAMIDALVDLIDAGSPPGTLVIRTGTAPTNTTDADTGTLLATLTFSATAFGAGSSGVATAASITSDSSVDNTGTAGYFRIKNAAGTVIAQGTCGVSGADINFDSVSFIAAGTCAITSLVLTMPAGS